MTDDLNFRFYEMFAFEFEVKLTHGKLYIYSSGQN